MTAGTAPGISTAEMLMTLLLLVLVLAATFYATRYIAKLGSRQQQFRSGGSNVRLTSRLPIGRSQSVVTVVYNGREYLLGVTEGHITTIDSKTLSDAELDALRENEKAGDFSQRLSSAVGKFTKNGGGVNR